MPTGLSVAPVPVAPVLAARPISVPAAISILITLPTLFSPLGSDLFAQPPGPVLWRASASQLAGEALAKPLDLAPTEAPREGGPDRLRGPTGREPHRDEISGDLGSHFQARHRRLATGGAGDMSREFLHFPRRHASAESIRDRLDRFLPLSRGLDAYSVPLSPTNQIA